MELKRIEKNEAADLTGVFLSPLRKHIYGQQRSALLDDFPDHCWCRQGLLWKKQDILDWLESQRTYVLGSAAGVATNKTVVVENEFSRKNHRCRHTTEQRVKQCQSLPIPLGGRA